jgi:hypothetical protein
VDRNDLPLRFRVEFGGYARKPATYTVCTWQDELKAAAVAAMHHAVIHRGNVQFFSSCFRLENRLGLLLGELDPLAAFGTRRHANKPTALRTALLVDSLRFSARRSRRPKTDDPLLMTAEHRGSGTMFSFTVRPSVDGDSSAA